jgi:hypothetical protein
MPGPRQESHSIWRKKGFWTPIYLLSFLAFVTLQPVPVHAADALFGWLLYASNDGQSGAIPESLAKFNRRLPQALGFSSLRVIADGQTTVDAQGQRILIFSSEIKIMITSLSRGPNNTYLASILFFQSGQPELEAQVKVSRNSPLFIRGPDWRDGQLIIAVMVRS